MQFDVKTNSVEATEELGQQIGRLLKGGEVIELASDLGGGKTTLTRGIAKGLGSTETVQSPSFTINFIYPCANNLELHHYDFYRLDDPGVVADQLSESLHQPQVVTVIEWAGSVKNRLELPLIKIKIRPTEQLESRIFEFEIPAQSQLIKLKESK